MSQKRFTEGNTNTSLKDVKQFYDALISTTWLIESYSDKCGYGTGFCINPRGFILTCAHIIKCEEATYVCPAESSKEKFTARVVGISHSFDMALLQVMSDEDKKFDYIKFADENDIHCGQEVHSIGNSNRLMGTFLSGRLAYPFEGYHHSVFDFDIGGAKRRFIHGASLNDRILDYRDVRSIASNDMETYAELNPDIPLIQISNLCGLGGGSPVFDNRGCVIGMLAVRHACYYMAIHFCALKQFIQHFDLDDEAKKPKAQEEKDLGCASIRS